MAEASPPLPLTEPGDPAELASTIDAASPTGALRQLVGEVKLAITSEVELAKACAAVIGASTKTMSIWGAVALLAVFVALLSLAIGIMIALATITGPWLAAVIVPGSLLGIAAIAGLIVRSAALRAKAAVGRLTA